jgi:hypothetical protein
MQMLREAVVTKDGKPNGQFVGYVPAATLANCNGPELVGSLMMRCSDSNYWQLHMSCTATRGKPKCWNALCCTARGLTEHTGTLKCKEGVIH